MLGWLAAAKRGKGIESDSQVARSNDAIAAWRSSNKSTVQLAGQLLSDPLTQSLTRMLERFVRPIRAWYGQQSVDLRTSHSLCKWVKAQCIDGALWTPLQETLSLLQDRGALEHVKLKVDFSEADRTMGRDHPSVAGDDELASAVAKYVFALVSARASRQTWAVIHFPGLVAGVGSMLVAPNRRRLAHLLNAHATTFERRDIRAFVSALCLP